MNVRKSILVVDDEVEIGKALRRLLRAEFDVEVATSGTEALERLAHTPVDLVLSDFRMPGMNGAELLMEVKRLYPATVRAMLSGYADFNSVLAAVNDGEIVRFIRKPWDDVELVGLLKRLLAARDMAAALYQPFRAARSGVEAAIGQSDSAAQVNVKMNGAPFDRQLALDLIRRFLGAINESEMALVGGLLEQNGGKLSFLAEVGGEHRLTLEVPLAQQEASKKVPPC